jgi:hypothetical protein
MFVRHAALLATSLVAWPARGARAEVDAGIMLVDRDLPGSAVFARAARARGVMIFEFAGDVASVWMRELEPRLRAGPVTIAGFVSAATLFCLDLLARDYGACTVERIDEAAAVSFVISQSPGQRATLAPAAVRAQWRNLHA